VRLRWKTAAGAVVAAALGGVAPAVSQAGPATATKDFSKPAIVILGYGLAPDASMRAILRRRVMTGLIVAQFFPQSPIIVTGGNPQNCKTEAGQMRNMLMLLGFPADRIILEDKANSTVQKRAVLGAAGEGGWHVGDHSGDIDYASGACRWGLRRRRRQSVGDGERSRIVLAAADGGSNTELSQRLRLAIGTVRRWRNRFAELGLDGLVDEPRPGRPRVVGDDRIEALIVATLETTPADATRWSTRSMADHLGLSQSMVSRVWRAFGLAPHKQDSWKLSKDPLFVAKVRDVVGLYLDPPERALVLCVDEKTQIQALNRTQPVFPMLPATPARASHDDVRHGTSSLYAALDLASGQVIGSLHARHRATEFLAFLRKIDAEVPADLDVHLVLDNASTHKTPAVKRWLTAHPRFVMHFTPTSSSWLNLVERWFSELTVKKLRRGTHTSVRQLNTDIRAWIDTWNDNPRPYVWTKTADQILASIGNYCTRINDSGH
jgi:transposase